MSRRGRKKVAPTQWRGAAGNDGGMHAVRRGGLTKTAFFRCSTQSRPERHQLEMEAVGKNSHILNSKLLLGKPVGHPMHPNEFAPGTASSFFPRYRHPRQLEEETEKQKNCKAESGLSRQLAHLETIQCWRKKRREEVHVHRLPSRSTSR